MNQSNVSSSYKIEKTIDVISFYNSAKLSQNSYIWINHLLEYIFNQTMESYNLPTHFLQTMDNTHKPFSKFSIALILKDYNHFDLSEKVLNLTVDKFLNFIQYFSDTQLTAPVSTIKYVEIQALYDKICISNCFNYDCINHKIKRI